MQSLYTARLGLKAQQQRIDEIASNIANVDTAAYKSQNTYFKDTLYTSMADTGVSAATPDLYKGTGIKLAATYRDYTAGTPEETSRTLDLYIEGDGFFAVEGNNGGLLYTRNGNFKVSNEGDGNYLVTSQGEYVVNTNGSRIRLTDVSNVTVSENGVISSGGNVDATLKIVTFTNKDGLSLTGNGLYEVTGSSGAEISTGAVIKQGYLESSNVDVTRELTHMISAQRSFALASKALGAWNDMETTANSLRT
jgi:flagellar basal-body rod protein FlgG